MPTLSLCVMTAGPVERVGALLEILRPRVDEVVLAVDHRVDDDRRTALAALADRCLVVPTSSVVEALGWMLHACRSDWILRLDDDEVPSAALLDDLSALLARSDITNVCLRRHWLYPDAGHRVTTRPWAPDFQCRLVRNLPGLWRFSGQVHLGLQVTGPRHFAAHGIHHLDPLLLPVERRRAKRDAFDALRPGLVNDGFPVNGVYVPEDHDVATEAVPDADRSLIARVLEPRAVAAPPSGPAAVEVVDPMTWPRVTDTRDASRDLYDASIHVSDVPAELPADAVVHVEVECANHGSEWWGHDSAPPTVHVGARWFDTGGRPVGPESRVALPETVRPGAVARVLLGLRAPDRAGHHDVEIDLVHEHVRWFGVGARHRIAVGGHD